MTQIVLKIESSAATGSSVTRQLTNELAAIVATENASIVSRDLNAPLPFLNENWIGAAYSPKESRTEDQKAALAQSDELIAELQGADTIIIGAPIYNFSIPAVLKAWIDQIARVGVTFKYTENGPVGLMGGKKVYIVAASGGVPIGSAVDFAVPYLKQVLGFFGITDIEVIAAEGVAVDRDGAIAKARSAMEGLTAKAA